MREMSNNDESPAMDTGIGTTLTPKIEGQHIERWVANHPSKITMICAEYGMGRTTILNRVVLECTKRRIPSKYMDFVGMDIESTLYNIRELQRWTRRQKTHGRTNEPRSVIACDNMTIGDESDVEGIVKMLRRIVSGGHSVIIASLPEGELLAERLGGAHCLWTCDLRAKRPAGIDEGLLFDEYAQGIPLLAHALAKVEDEFLEDVATDPSYQAPYISMVENCVYNNMMGEERMLRCSMLLLGSGTFAELTAILGDVDESLWRIIARDSLLFGVDVSRAAFTCVGSRSLSCLNVAYASLRQMVRPWPALVERAAQILASRGDMSRAAIVSLMCDDDKLRCAIGLRWGSRMIDVGEVTVVSDALELARTHGFTTYTGYVESSVILGALLGKKPMAHALPAGGTRETVSLRHACLAQRCRDMAKGVELEEELDVGPDNDLLSSTLVVHANAFRLMISGQLRDAYELLLGSSTRLGEPTISSGLVEMDFMLCSLMLGIVPNSVDVEIMRKTTVFFERAGLPQLSMYLDACVEAGSLLSGRLRHEGRLEAAQQRATRYGNSLWRGMLLVASAVSDMRIGAFTRAHVRLEQAKSTLGSSDTSSTALFRIALLLHCAVRAQLGERIPKTDFERCRGISKLHDDVVAMLVAALVKEKPKRFSLAGGWSATSKSREVHWLINVLSNDCGSVSRRFRRVVPLAWLDAQARIAHEVDEFFESLAMPKDFMGSAQLSVAEDKGAAMRKLAGEHCVTVRMLGGFEVYVDGSSVSASRFERRRAKALLALLAAVPGHVAKRYVIMESIWPSHDYDTANKCVYSATSTLRSEIGTLLGKDKIPTLIYTNKAQGTVSLNANVFGTDVDLFEGAARSVLDMEGMEREVVALCRDVEDIYRGDLFVPPTDGLGLVGTRARELRSLFADAMIVGARAAISLGMKTIACRFAHKAFDADDLREDGMRTLAAALCAAGRHVEATKCFERFVGRVVDCTRQPPSRQLREDVEALLKDCAKAEFEHRSRASQKHSKRLLEEVHVEDEQLSFDLENAS